MKIWSASNPSYLYMVWSLLFPSEKWDNRTHPTWGNHGNGYCYVVFEFGASVPNSVIVRSFESSSFQTFWPWQWEKMISYYNTTNLPIKQSLRDILQCFLFLFIAEKVDFNQEDWLQDPLIAIAHSVIEYCFRNHANYSLTNNSSNTTFSKGSLLFCAELAPDPFTSHFSVSSAFAYSILFNF